MNEESRQRRMRFVLRAAAAIAAIMVSSQPAVGYQQQIDAGARRIAEAMERASRKTVAVVDFTDLQANVTELGRFLAEQLSNALGSGGGTFDTIDRTQLRALLQEHKLSTTGLIDAQTARKLGQIAGAECLVTG